MTVPTIEKLYSIAGNVWNAFASEQWHHLDRDDAIQAAVLQCWRSIDKHDPLRAGVNTYFSMICRHEMTNRNKQARRLHDVAPHSLNVEVAPGVELGSLQAARPETDMVEVRDEMAHLEAATVDLTVTERRDLDAMRCTNGPANLSRRLGVSRAAGSKRCRKILTKVRSIL
jgi:RNA polymerase sigma factor (sigma-70 family)